MVAEPVTQNGHTPAETLDKTETQPALIGDEDLQLQGLESIESSTQTETPESTSETETEAEALSVDDVVSQVFGEKQGASSSTKPETQLPGKTDEELHAEAWTNYSTAYSNLNQNIIPATVKSRFSHLSEQDQKAINDFGADVAQKLHSDNFERIEPWLEGAFGVLTKDKPRVAEELSKKKPQGAREKLETLVAAAALDKEQELIEKGWLSPKDAQTRATKAASQVEQNLLKRMAQAGSPLVEKDSKGNYSLKAPGNNVTGGGAPVGRITWEWIDKATPQQISALPPEQRAEYERVVSTRGR